MTPAPQRNANAAPTYGPHPGAAPVGRVLDLRPFELQIAIYLRLWCTGKRGQAEVWQDLVARLEEPDAAAALRAFEAFVRALLAGARRPLARHAVDCPCLGGDEAAIVRAVALAAAGDREDAAMILTWTMKPGAVDALVLQAEDAGLRIAAGSLPPRCFAPGAPRR